MTKHLPLPLRILFGAVILNYLAQIPYALHLYGFNVNPRGALLLVFTLSWFLVGFWLLTQQHPGGYWLMLGFLAVQVVFYFNNEIILMVFGYGLVYHLLTFSDPVVWAVELVGIINFLVAAYALYYLLRYKTRLIKNAPFSAAELG